MFYTIFTKNKITLTHSVLRFRYLEINSPNASVVPGENAECP